MDKIRILHVLPTLSRAGSEMFVLNNLRAIDKSRFEFMVLSLSSEHKDLEKEMSELCCPVYYCDISFESIHHLLSNIIRLAKILRGLDYDIIHCHKSHECGPVFLASHLAGRRKCIAHSHFALYDEVTGGVIRRFVYSRFLPFMTIHLGDVFCACSEDSAVALYGRSVNPVIIANVIELNDFFDRDENVLVALRKDLSIPEDVKVYGNISRYARQKNTLFVVDIFNEIHRKEPSSILVLAGKHGDLYDETVERVEKYSLQASVRILDQRSDVNNLLQLLDCVIFPSLYEGFPYQVLEAQASSVPVVLSDVLSKAYDFGLGLIRYANLDESPDKWAELVMSMNKKLICKDEIRAAFASNGFDVSSVVRNLEDTYSYLYALKK